MSLPPILFAFTLVFLCPFQSYGSDRDYDFKANILGSGVRGLTTLVEYPFVRVAKSTAAPQTNMSVFEAIKQLHKLGGYSEFYKGGVSYVVRKGPQWLYRGVIKHTYEAQATILNNYPFAKALGLGFILGAIDGTSECASDKINTIYTTERESKMRFKQWRPFIYYLDADSSPRRIPITPKFLFGTLSVNMKSSILAWSGFLGFWEIYKSMFSDEQGDISISKRGALGLSSGVSSSLLTSSYHYRLIHLQSMHPIQRRGFFNDLGYLIARDGWRPLLQFTVLKTCGIGVSAFLTGMFFMQQTVHDNLCP